MFEVPLSGELTQGSVFSCAYAENYKEGAVLGLVITARCDIAQGKTPVFTYIPVVPLSSWLSVDGFQILLDRQDADCLNTVETLLKNNDLSVSLLKGYSLDSIFDAHFKPLLEVKAKKAQAEKFVAQILRMKRHHELRHPDTSVSKINDFLSGNRPAVESLLKELFGNRLSGYYFLKDLSTFDEPPEEFHIALLREVHHIPAAVAKGIEKGYPAPADWKTTTFGKCPTFRNQGDVAMSLAKLRSPWIEHLMQNFSLLFSRIGIPDVEENSWKKPLAAFKAGG